jgi:hypothetical protein
MLSPESTGHHSTGRRDDEKQWLHGDQRSFRRKTSAPIASSNVQLQAA